MLKRLLCPRLPAPGAPVELTGAEAHHAAKVLRLQSGDRVEAIDGKGNAVTALLQFKGEKVRLEFDSAAPVARSEGQVVPVTLELAVLKGDAMEWAVEKAVELGAQALVPVLTERTVVQVKGKGPEAFRERWQRIADQALKQCGRLQSIQVEAPVELEVLLSKKAAETRLWFDESGRDVYLAKWLAEQKYEGLRLLVGPEGGWSETEREILLRSSVVRLGLGPNVLRAETAALFSLSLATAAIRLTGSR